ncbi:hypothetical protein P4O66_019966, partial [Electrophorus voltai]
ALYMWFIYSARSNMQQVWSVCFGRETFGPKKARHSQEDDCYYVQEMFDPVRVTHFSEGSSILEDTTDSDGDISKAEVRG